MSHESTVVLLLMCPYLSPVFHLLPGCQCKQTASSTATWETSEIFHVSCRETLAIVSRCLLLQPRGYRRRKLKRRATRDARNMNWWYPVFLEDLLCLKSQAVPEVAAQAWTGQKTVQSWKKFISHLPSTIRQVRTMPLLRSNLTEGFLALQDRNNFDKWESLWFQSSGGFFLRCVTDFSSGVGALISILHHISQLT